MKTQYKIYILKKSLDLVEDWIMYLFNISSLTLVVSVLGQVSHSCAKSHCIVSHCRGKDR